MTELSVPTIESTLQSTGVDGLVDVLVVDDNPTNRVVCRGALKGKGYRVREACDGEAALVEVANQPPDVILMDVLMPKMDGLECTRRLKSSEATRDIPVILVSACNDAGDILAGLKAGADEYIGKPLKVAELEVRVRTMARSYRNRRAVLEARESRAVAEALKAELEQRRTIEEDLRQAKIVAESASQAKSEFLATMSHELRTPLNGVIGMTELLLRTTLDDQQRRYASVAKHSGDALLCLINDILDFSKIEAGKVELESVDFDVSDAVTCTLATLQQRATAKGLALVSVIHPRTTTSVRGDPGRLQQILLNLTSNAIKFTESGQVTLRVVVEEQTTTQVTIRFTIDDTGIGIPAERLNRLFRPFSQVDASTTRKYGGTGLGLTICKRLVEMMDGSIGVTSEPGFGSTFWFVVKLGYASAGTRTPPPFLGDLRRTRVLAVDDNAINRELIQEQLSDYGIMVETAYDVSTAFAALRDAARLGTPFELAILDMCMPGGDGELLAQAIKSDPEVRDTILIMLSSSEERHDAATLRTLGFAAWLTKPVSGPRLLDTMASALACATHSVDESLTPPADEHPSAGRDEHQATTRILLADDNEIGREVAGATLEQAGYSCDKVCNGLEAVQAALGKRYDVILMDCQMPEMDGFEATQAIRQNEAARNDGFEALGRVAIIALTANAIKGDRERCLAAGMDDYLTKPFETNELIALIQRYSAKASASSGAPDPREHCVPNPGTREPKHTPAKPSEMPDSSPFKLDTLLKRWGNDRVLVDSFIAMFRRQAPTDLQLLEQRLGAGDVTESTRLAHGLKGAAAYVSADGVREWAARLEDLGRAGDLSDAPRCLENLKSELQRCLEGTPQEVHA